MNPSSFIRDYYVKGTAVVANASTTEADLLRQIWIDWQHLAGNSPGIVEMGECPPLSLPDSSRFGFSSLVFSPTDMPGVQFTIPVQDGVHDQFLKLQPSWLKCEWSQYPKILLHRAVYHLLAPKYFQSNLSLHVMSFAYVFLKQVDATAYFNDPLVMDYLCERVRPFVVVFFIYLVLFSRTW